MSKRESIARYNLIIKKLRRNPSSFDDIASYLSRESELQSYNFNTSKRTFQRDLDDIRALFNIDVQYDFSRKVYFIHDEDQPEINERMLEAFDTFNALNVSDRLSKYIHFEKRRPQGTENLHGLLHAIKNRFQIHFTYQKYWQEESEVRTAEPYALKEFKNRWYVLVKDLKDEKIKSFALDRLTELDITRRTFKYPKDFDIDEFYRYSFGIISANGQQPQEIILSFNHIQGKYVKSLPLHETQELMVDNAEEVRICVRVCITYDFIMELMSFGDKLKILKPKSLIKTVKAAHQKASAQYE